MNAGRGAAPAGRGNAPAAGRGAPPAGGAPGGPPAGPAIRATSTTSYYDEPITHRITNAGDRLFRFMVVTNASAGDQSNTESGAGFPGKPELSNRWFRAYRLTLAPGQATELHRHTTESVIFQISDGKALAAGPMTFELYEQGRWAWFDTGKTHEIRNVGTTPVEFIEVEVRAPVTSPVASR
jgi:quercetin dioxygenase-like cupin family protein